MSRKEWREVFRQSLYFLLAMAAMALLVGAADLVSGSRSEGEKIVVMAGLWLLVFSMFLGLTPFAMDSKQKGMEYLLTLPVSRRRLLLIKLLPRLAAVVIFYIAFVLLYALMGHGAFSGGVALFNLTYFALFLISFSLSVVDENFIVQSIWVGIALCGYLALCLGIVALGFSWKFRIPVSRVGAGIWHDLSYDPATLLAAVAVFLLLASPFIASFFLAFKKFDLKPARTFNRRHLRLFIPMLLITLALSLAMTYLVQAGSAYEEADFHILRDRRLLRAEFPGKMWLYDEAGRRKIDAGQQLFWGAPLLERGDRLFLSGYDVEDGGAIIGSLELSSLSWKIVHRYPHRYIAAPGPASFRYDGEDLVYLRRNREDLAGRDDDKAASSDTLELVRINPDNGRARTIAFRSPYFLNPYVLRFIGCDVRQGRRFWLIAQHRHNILRLWEDGRVEDLGVSMGIPAYAAGLLFSCGDHSMKVSRLLNAGSEMVKEIPGAFSLPYLTLPQAGSKASEIYGMCDKRIVRIDLARPDGAAVDDLGPEHGSIRELANGSFYYVEFESWPGQGSDRWKKLYRLQDGRKVFLMRFDFADAGYGHLLLTDAGVTLLQKKGERTTRRFFALPDLGELKFDNLD